MPGSWRRRVGGAGGWPAISGARAMVGRKRIRRLMRRMGLVAVYREPRTIVPHPEHRKWPYLLRGLAIDRPDHVWCADIAYVPMRRARHRPRTNGGLAPSLVERLWRSLKFECISLHAFETGSETRAGIGKGWPAATQRGPTQPSADGHPSSPTRATGVSTWRRDGDGPSVAGPPAPPRNGDHHCAPRMAISPLTPHGGASLF